MDKDAKQVVAGIVNSEWIQPAFQDFAHDWALCVPVQVRRTWRERLLSWPWRPWVKTRLAVKMYPIRGAKKP